VIKRDGTRAPLDLLKLRSRFENKSAGLNMKYINFDVIVAKLASGIYQGKSLSPSNLINSPSNLQSLRDESLKAPSRFMDHLSILP
jgi:hypothetical protein